MQQKHKVMAEALRFLKIKKKAERGTAYLVKNGMLAAKSQQLFFCYIIHVYLGLWTHDNTWLKLSAFLCCCHV